MVSSLPSETSAKGAVQGGRGSLGWEGGGADKSGTFAPASHQASVCWREGRGGEKEVWYGLQLPTRERERERKRERRECVSL